MPRTTHFLVVCLALIALGLGAVVWRQGQEIRRLAQAQQRAAEASRVIRVNRPLVQAPPSVTGARTQSPWMRSAGAGLQDEAEALAGQRTPAESERRPAGLARLLEDPVFLRALAVHQEGALDARYAALFRRLNLSGEELAAFKRRLVERDNVVLDIAAISQEMPGEPLTTAMMQASARAARAQIESAIRQSLGQERYAVYSDYVNTLPQRATVARLEQRLSYSSAPLQPAQADTLVTILAQNPTPPTTTRAPVDAAETTFLPNLSPPAPVSDQAVEQAQSVLSPAQVAALRQIQAETEAAAEVAHSIHRVVVPSRDGAGDSPWLQLYLQ